MLAHLRYAVRILAKRPAFAAVTILTLALGIGANTAIFTIANALLLRPLPYADPGRLVLISATPSSGREGGGELSFPHFTLLAGRNRSFAGVSAATFEIFNMTGHGDPEQILSARVSWNFFAVLGVRPVVGRTFFAEEDRPDARQVVLISYELWMRLFGGDRDAVGRSLTLDTRDCTIVGILPPNFSVPLIGQKTDIWAPRVFDLSLVTPARVNAGGAYFHVIGRLRYGVSREQAQAELRAIYQQYRHDYPGNYDATRDCVMLAQNLQEVFTANLRPTLLVLSAAVGFVLLIACANVTSLLLARALGREKEFAVRTALGAPRSTLIYQLLTESVLLAVVSGLAGVLLGFAGTKFLADYGETTFPQIAAVQMDARVLAFTLLISIACGVLFGLTPSLQLSKPDLNTMLRDEGRGTIGNRRRNRARSLLVIAQVALSTVLLVGTGLLIRSFIKLRTASPGFEPKNLLTLEMTLPPTKYSQRVQLVAFYNSAIQHVQPLPGVEAVALSTAVPAYATHQTPALFEGLPEVPIGKRPIVNIQQISPDYAKTLRVPILAGRAFTGHDDAQAPPAAIVNQSTVRSFWPNENPIGKRIWIGNVPAPFEVVGVLADTKNYGLALAPQPEVFLPLPQLPWSLLYMSVRTAIDPHKVISAVRRAIAEVDRDQPVTRVLTGDELLESACAQPRFVMFLLGVFSATAFILAVIGIYGVIAYSVAQRTSEIGIRIALGAARSDIFRLVIGNGLVLTLAGILIGLAGALALTRVMSSMLYQTSATDPLTFLISAALFTAVAVAASYVPARRATRIDPTDALRFE